MDFPFPACQVPKQSGDSRSPPFSAAGPKFHNKAVGHQCPHSCFSRLSNTPLPLFLPDEKPSLIPMYRRQPQLLCGWPEPFLGIFLSSSPVPPFCLVLGLTLHSGQPEPPVFAPLLLVPQPWLPCHGMQPVRHLCTPPNPAPLCSGLGSLPLQIGGHSFPVSTLMPSAAPP